MLRPVRVTGRYEGCDNEAFQINGERIFRFPKRAEGELPLEVLRHYQGEVDAGFLDRVRLYGVCSAIADYHYGVMAGIDKNRQIGLAALERSFLVSD